MSDYFQPDEPHAEAKEPAGWGAIILVSAVSALLVVMILAILAPRLVEDYSQSWAVTFGAGALTFVIILAIGFIRRARRQAAGRSKKRPPSQ